MLLVQQARLLLTEHTPHTSQPEQVGLQHNLQELLFVNVAVAIKVAQLNHLAQLRVRDGLTHLAWPCVDVRTHAWQVSTSAFSVFSAFSEMRPVPSTSNILKPWAVHALTRAHVTDLVQ